MRALIGCLLCLLTTIGVAQPKLLLILVHEPLTPDDFGGVVPFQAAWVVWNREQYEPAAFAANVQVKPQPKDSFSQYVIYLVNSKSSRTLLSLREESRSINFLRFTLGAQLNQAGRKGIYLSTPRSPAPTPYALIVLSEDGSVPAKIYPNLEALRRDFFQLDADWALLELKRWDYSALELLLAEGVEVWVVGIPSPEGLVFTKTRLSPVIRYWARGRRGLLTSPSTRWNGVIRESDIAPSLYQSLTGEVSGNWSGAPAFETRQSEWHRYWNGWLIRLVLAEAAAVMDPGWRGNALQRSAAWAQAQAHLAPPLRTALATFWAVWLCLGTVFWYARRLKGLLRRVFVSGLAVFCLTPAIAILYAYYPFDYWTGDKPRDVASIAAWLTLGWAGLSQIMAGLARWGRMPLLCSAASVALITIGADILLAGGYGAKRSLLSEGVVGGGCPFCLNEWFWGFALAAAVLAPASWLESRGRLGFGARGRTALGMAYGLLLGLFGLPMLGAALDAWIPTTLAFGAAIALFTGVLRPTISSRQGVALLIALLIAGGTLTALAVALDSWQSWQQQAGWARGWLTALGWRFDPIAALAIAGATAGVIYWLRNSIRLLWYRAGVIHAAIAVCAAVAGVGLLTGKVAASVTILLLGVLFALEYLIGGKDWGYAYEGNGVAR